MSYATKDEVAQLGEKSLELEAYMDQHDLHDAIKLQAHLTPIQSLNPDQGQVLRIPLRDSQTLPIRVFRPKVASDAPKPLIVLIHGGGFVYGDNTSYSPAARTLATLYNAICVNTTYRLAPMHEFPTAAHDTHDALKWLSQNGAMLGADPTKGFILFGGSAGASLAAVVAQQWVSCKAKPRITGLSLNVPMMLAEDIVPEKEKQLWFSMTQNADALVLNAQAQEYFMSLYAPDIHSVDFSPFNDPAPHVGMPPTHVMVCGADLLRDDGLIYERALRENGVKTKLSVYPGMPHALGVFRGFEGAQRAFKDEMRGVGWLMEDEKTDQDVEEVVQGCYFSSI